MGRGNDQARPGPRFRESMPAPLMAAFAALALGALGMVLWLILAPPRFRTVPVAERRPPPVGFRAHGVGRLIPAPAPEPPPRFEPPCPELGAVAVEGGPPAHARFRAALRPLCRLFDPGAPAEAREALRGLAGATIRFARFERTGVESTSDVRARRIWINLRFARSETPPVEIAPLLVHEARHLADRDRRLGASAELDAREAELAVCRALIAADRWPRHCGDAEDVVRRGRAGATEVLVEAGYAR